MHRHVECEKKLDDFNTTQERLGGGETSRSTIERKIEYEQKDFKGMMSLQTKGRKQKFKKANIFLKTNAYCFIAHL